MNVMCLMIFLNWGRVNFHLMSLSFLGLGSTQKGPLIHFVLAIRGIGYLIPLLLRAQVGIHSVCHGFCLAPNFRIIQHLNSPLSESCKYLVTGPNYSVVGVPIYVQNKPLAFRLRLFIDNSPVLRMKSRIEI